MDNFLQSTVIDSQDALDDALENPRFFDIVPLGKSAGIALSDGQVLNDKTVIYDLTYYAMSADALFLEDVTK